MQYWLLKTEPSTYSFDDLRRDGQTVWDGVRNAQALIHLRAMRPGDQVLIYHSGNERAVVGTATIDGEPYADPRSGEPKHPVVNIRAGEPVKQPVPLATIKADQLFAAMALIRQPRLSVVPLTGTQWQRLIELAGLGAAKSKEERHV